jgi:thiamine biosynthesis lipoprotein
VVLLRPLLGATLLLLLLTGAGHAERLVLEDMDGNPHDVDAILAAGRNVTLVFWQTWCSSCKREAPHLVEAVEVQRGAIDFFGVVAGPDRSVDEAKVRATARDWGFTHPQVRDRDLELAHAYDAFGTPVIVVIGPGREVLYHSHRLPKDWTPLRGRGASAAGRPTALPGAALAASAAEAPDGLVLRERELGVMGTELQLRALGPDAAALDRALDAAIAELRRVEDVMTDWRPSPLTRLNDAAGRGATEVPEELASILARSFEISRVTGGAFDVSYAAAGHLWSFEARTPRLPDPEAVRAALAHVGWERVRVDPERHTVVLPAGMKLGLGGIAKGYGVDRAMDVLLAYGVEHAIVNAGGDMKVLGRKFGEPWEVAIKHPRDRERAIAALRVSNTSVVTSGDYERFFEIDGRRYHHIIDPRTGQPADKALSATVLNPSAELADALATALCVMGPEKGLALVARLARTEAIVVGVDGAVHASDGLRSALR